MSFEQAGTLARISAKEGQQVTLGEAVAKLDTTVLEEQRLQTQAELAQARADLALVDRDIQRHHQLQERQLARARDLDELLTNQTKLTNQIRALTAVLATQDHHLQQAVLKAPFAGLITQRLLDEGSIVAPGEAVFTMEQTSDRLELQINLPPHWRTAIDEETRFTVTQDGLSQPAQWLALPHSINPQTQALDLRLHTAASEQLLPGSRVQVEIQRRSHEQGYALPLGALQEGSRGVWSVLAVDHGVITRHTVSILELTDTQVFVQGDLRVGMKILRNGTHRVVPGQRIDVLSSDQ